LNPDPAPYRSRFCNAVVRFADLEVEAAVGIEPMNEREWAARQPTLFTG
jgi:hypothetical protein